jgi:ATP-dependent phosphofructokinase / diphosphate-dependent phosphofructokinase
MARKPDGKVALVFSGGPAPAANAVISSAALGFLDNGVSAVGLLDGFTFVQDFDGSLPLLEGKHYLDLDTTISTIRNQRGIFLRSARANPGKEVKSKSDLADPVKTIRLKASAAALRSLGVTALVTLGGDDTLKTANFMHLLGMPTIHIPKTIDNDYFGIPWTFGYWTAVDTARKALLNLKADADSTNAYFLVELMGRSAGWMTYAAGIAGEACDMVAAEDLDGDLDPDALASRFADLIIAREMDGRRAGLICIAEGLAERLGEAHKPKEVDAHGNVYYGRAELCRTLAEKAMALYQTRTGRVKKINPKQIGYETRCAEPCAFDVVLGSMLGHGAWRLFSEGRFGHMVSVEENLDIKAIPFGDLVDPVTMKTKVRLVPRESDLFRLKNALSYPVPQA